MKITAFILLAFCLHVSATTLAQNVTLAEHKAPLEKVLNDIRRQTGYVFFYNQDWMQQAQPVDINVKNVPLDEALKVCFANQPYSYAVVNKTIVLKLKSMPVQAVETVAAITISGRVTDTTGTPLIGATVSIKGGKTYVTDEKGEFSFEAQTGDQVIITFVGYNSYAFTVTNDIPFQNISLHAASNNLSTIIVSTGYQDIPLERATGSYSKIGNELLNHNVSSNILGRLQNVTSGLLSDDHFFYIRGRSTILGNNSPLIVLDNFEYNGDINNINPNDVESVTVLKDAASASIWGAKAGNGVIVINTKKGAFNQKNTVSLSSNITIADKPDLFAATLMSSADYAGVERYLFNNNYYVGRIQFPRFLRYPLLSPVVELLNAAKIGQISQQAADEQINLITAHDVRSDYLKFFYRKSVAQRNFINMSGGSETHKYYVSIGYDNNLSNVIGNRNDRLTANIGNTFSLLQQKLTISTQLIITQTKLWNNGLTTSGVPYPYARLVDANGNPASLELYNPVLFTSTAQYNFLNWNYQPLNELNYADNTTVGQDYQAKIGLKYKVVKNFNLDLNYLYGHATIDTRNFHDQQSYFSRDLINQYTQVDSNGSITHPIPIGGILDFNNSAYTSQNFRAQFNYSNIWSGKHQFYAIAGAEINDLTNTNIADRFYGYDPQHDTSIPVDYVTTFTNFVSHGANVIPNNQNQTDLTNRYISYYANASYTYDDKYIFSASARKNASNLFGVNENQKGIPLWSVGGSWEISKEHFYQWAAIPYLRFRATYGYSGNVDKSITAFLISRSTGLNRYQLPESTIQSPPNPDLRWEKDGMFNVGLDYATKNNRITGSIEYFRKKGTDLFGYEPLAFSAGIVNPSTGTTLVRKNTADMSGSGADIQINSKNVTGIIGWNSQFLFSMAKDYIVSYKEPNATITDYVFANNPVVGKPVSALYTYRSAGLNSSGDPQGYLNGAISTDYSSILASTDPKSLIYNGPQQPTIFGNLLNTFSYRNLSFSFNITYKLGYVFLRPSVNYNTLFKGVIGNSDFTKRWQKPGDEKFTDVPALIYPDNAQRDQFYQYSSVLVEKGDQVRLQDIQLAYDFRMVKISGLSIRSIRLYCYASNLGIIWRANKDKLDPDTAPYGAVPVRPSFTLGLQSNF